MEYYVIMCEYKTNIDFGGIPIQVLHNYKKAKKRLVEIIKDEYKIIAKNTYPDITLDEFVDKFWKESVYKDFWEIKYNDLPQYIQELFPNKIERYYICTPEITE